MTVLERPSALGPEHPRPSLERIPNCKTWPSRTLSSGCHHSQGQLNRLKHPQSEDHETTHLPGKRDWLVWLLKEGAEPLAPGFPATEQPRCPYSPSDGTTWPWGTRAEHPCAVSKKLPPSQPASLSAFQWSFGKFIPCHELELFMFFPDVSKPGEKTNVLLHEFSQRTEVWKVLPNSFYEASVNPIPEPSTRVVGKKQQQTNISHEQNAKSLNRMLEGKEEISN